ncbi:MAG: hypothetical protein P1P90_02855 [Patescibacteria group bacterium]|nr:hypothetical protein [Patescibacteria group bacterium]
MPPFIFITQEGLTQAPNLEDIENLQFLGITNGENSRQAFENLLQENDWIRDSDYTEVQAFELKSEKGEYFSISDN